eukprot:TRINITY_DN5194_c0_g1_i1.p1 TRINITY_DN5194_c0_g1~~TRINITY_DN5194_c0_g1_i1.p1  ORF type:complete len:110 (+),score=6.31 TRINITY_DN5194_c0_g1_i1:43-330(+)
MNNFLSKTFAGQVRTLGTKSKYLLAATCMFAIVQKQKHYRSRLQDEEEGTHDRVSREAHVILPDGRMAQVYPVVFSGSSFSALWRSTLETLNPLP